MPMPSANPEFPAERKLRLNGVSQLAIMERSALWRAMMTEALRPPALECQQLQGSQPGKAPCAPPYFSLAVDHMFAAVNLSNAQLITAASASATAHLLPPPVRFDHCVSGNPSALHDRAADSGLCGCDGSKT